MEKGVNKDLSESNNTKKALCNSIEIIKVILQFMSLISKEIVMSLKFMNKEAVLILTDLHKYLIRWFD